MAPLRGVVRQETFWCGRDAVHVHHAHGDAVPARVRALVVLTGRMIGATGETMAIESFGPGILEQDAMVVARRSGRRELH